MYLSSIPPRPVRTGPPIALTVPRLASIPSGDGRPSASAICPRRAGLFVGSATVAAARSSLSTAKSEPASRPATRAGISVPSARVTVISSSRSITWSAVRMRSAAYAIPLAGMRRRAFTSTVALPVFSAASASASESSTNTFLLMEILLSRQWSVASIALTLLERIAETTGFKLEKRVGPAGSSCFPMIGFLNPFPQRRMRIEQEYHPPLRIDLSEILIRQSRKGGRERFALPGRLQRVIVSHALPPAGDRVLNRHGEETVRAEDEHQCGECGDVRGTGEAK